MTEETSFAALLAENEPQTNDVRADLNVGDMVRGEVVAIDTDRLFVAIGAKTEAQMDIANVTDADGRLKTKVGDTIEARITGIDQETGALQIGHRHGHAVHGLEELEAAFRGAQPVEGQITAVIKGGLEVQIAGHRAFCPASQVDSRFVEDLSAFVGQRHEFRITKCSGGRRPDIVVSRRALLEEAQAAAAAETRARLEVGAVLNGTVTQLKEFGAFVDLGGVEGMIHISELAFGHVRHPEDMLRVGQDVEVQVLRIEQTQNPKRPEKIALSIRALAVDPWSEVESRCPVGTTVAGKVTRLQAFGAFVEVAPGLEGLIHISELGADRRIDHPEDVVQTGQQVKVRVLAIDLDKRRLSLALADQDELEPASPQAPERSQDRSNAERQQESAVGTLGELLREQMRKG